jgi:hypothetical protein
VSASIVIDEIPGMVEALHAVQLVGGVLLDPRAAHQLVVAAWYAAEPAARSAAFADAADVLVDLFGQTEALALLLAANVLDQISYEMRSPQ